MIWVDFIGVQIDNRGDLGIVYIVHCKISFSETKQFLFLQRPQLLMYMS